MSDPDIPTTKYSGVHEGCPIKVAHEHGLKRVENGYVPDQLVLSESVIAQLKSLIASSNTEERRFAARNLRNAPAGISQVLQHALDNESDPFTAGLIISALGTLKTAHAVTSIEAWVARAHEAFVAQNILESYLQILLNLDSADVADRESIRARIQQTLKYLSNFQDPAVAQEARRILDLFGL